MIYDECQTDIGLLRFILRENRTLVRMLLTDDLWSTFAKNNTVKKSSDLGEPIQQQLQEYLSGERQDFDLPFELVGTPFQKQSWNALQMTPYGETKSYFEIACSIERPQAIRALGNALSKNPLPIIFPCHRVIGKDKNLNGYAGGIDMKTQLLYIEGVNINELESK